MSSSNTIDQIVQQVAKLKVEEQADLVHKLQLLVKQNRQSARLSQLNGLGAHLWKGVDIKKYIDDQRAW